MLVFEYFINQDLLIYLYEYKMTLGLNQLSFYSELVWVTILIQAA